MGIGASSGFSDLMVKVYKENLEKLLSTPSEVGMNEFGDEPGDYEKYMAPWIEEKAAQQAQTEKLSLLKVQQAMELLSHEGTWELIDVGKAVEYIYKSMEKSAEEKFWGRIGK